MCTNVPPPYKRLTVGLRHASIKHGKFNIKALLACSTRSDGSRGSELNRTRRAQYAAKATSFFARYPSSERLEQAKALLFSSSTSSCQNLTKPSKCLLDTENTIMGLGF